MSAIGAAKSSVARTFYDNSDCILADTQMASNPPITAAFGDQGLFALD